MKKQADHKKGVLRLRYLFLTGAVVTLALLSFGITFVYQGFLLGSLACFLALLFIAEKLAAIALRSFYPFIEKSEAITPHPFCHFLPEDRSKFLSAHSSDIKKTLYFAGDCTAFEAHLKQEETLASKLALEMDGVRIVNAGAIHYSMMHSYHRFVHDLMTQDDIPHQVLLFVSVNDVLVFAHHKEGSAEPDYSHYYKTVGAEDIVVKIRSLPSSVLKLLSCYYLFDKRRFFVNSLFYERNPDFYSEENVAKAKELFSDTTFRKALDLFYRTCQSFGIELTLVTFYCNKADMVGETRKMYEEHVAYLNEVARQFAREYELRLIDFEKELAVLENGSDIFNKWSFTGSGNDKRTAILARELQRSYQHS